MSSGRSRVHLLSIYEEQKKTGSATQAGLLYAVTDFVQLGCAHDRVFRDTQPTIFNKLDHKSAEQQLWVCVIFIPLLRLVLRCFFARNLL